MAHTSREVCFRIAQTHVHPEELIIVVVGPTKTLKAGLEEIVPVTVVKEGNGLVKNVVGAAGCDRTLRPKTSELARSVYVTGAFPIASLELQQWEEHRVFIQSRHRLVRLRNTSSDVHFRGQPQSALQ